MHNERAGGPAKSVNGAGDGPQPGGATGKPALVERLHQRRFPCSCPWTGNEHQPEHETSETQAAHEGARELRSQQALIVLLTVSAGLAACVTPSQRAVRSLPTPRIHVLDCGTLAGRNLRTYGLPAEPRDMSVPCYLIVHAAGTLLWETGLGDRFVDEPNPRDAGWIVRTTLRSQLESLGHGPRDIDYLAISHMHADHTGNANDFAGATWLVQEPELAFAFEPERDTTTYAALSRSRKIVLHGDHDVFGDSSVVILSTPGHTPGHQSLLVRLPEAGVVILSGDLYHYPEERTIGGFPSFEYDRAQSAASRARIENVLTVTRGQLWIGHDIHAYGRLSAKGRAGIW